MSMGIRSSNCCCLQAIIDVLRLKRVDPLVTHAGGLPLAAGGSARFLNWMYLGIGIVGLFLGGGVFDHLEKSGNWLGGAPNGSRSCKVR